MRVPEVSLILVGADDEALRARTIASVLAQTRPDWELLVCQIPGDDLPAAAANDRRVAIVPCPDPTDRSGCLALAFGRCRGAHLGMLEAGSWLAPQRLERQLRFLAERLEIGLAATFLAAQAPGAAKADPDEVAWFNRELDLARPEHWGLREILGPSSVLVRRATYDRLGGLDLALQELPELDFWLRARARRCGFGVLAEPLTFAEKRRPVTGEHWQRLFIEACFLFSARLAPSLVHIDRADLLAEALRGFARRFLARASAPARLAVIGELAGFMLHPTAPAAFARSLAAACGSHWQAALDAFSQAADPEAAEEPPPRRPARPGKLVAIDAIFPDVLCSFGRTELNHYLTHLDAEVLATCTDFDRLATQYAVHYPHLRERVRRFTSEAAADASLFYFIFLDNAYQHLPLVERLGRPFVFSLYPGGKLQLNAAVSDLWLQRVLRSPMLRKVIVTQNVTRDYLLARGYCDADRIELIYGLVLPADLYADSGPPRRRFPERKGTFDICFVAFKYMPRGADKGYDTFVEVARRLSRANSDFRFHVVGNYGPRDVPLREAEGRITFHPPQFSAFFPRFHAGMDVILSPNVPFRVYPGAFDGFPTGCCVEASLCGVAMMCSDELGENRGRYAPDEEISIVRPRADEIVERLMAWHEDPEGMYRLGEAGRRRSQKLFDTATQLDRRLAVLRECL